MRQFTTIVIAAVFSGIIFCLGLLAAMDQHRRIQSTEPVQAVILSSKVEERLVRRKHSFVTEYHPAVRYRYTYQGRTYTSDAVLPMFTFDTSYEWASDVVSFFPKDHVVEAYCNPEDPGQAFLLPIYSYFPYVLMQIPIALILTLELAGLGNHSASKPMQQPDGSFLLSSGMDIGTQVWIMIVGTVLCFALALGPTAHYYRYTEFRDGLAMVWTVLGLGVSVVSMLLAARLALLYFTVEQTRVTTRTDVFKLGAPLGTRTEIKARHSFTMKELTARLLCIEYHERDKTWFNWLFFRGLRALPTRHEVWSREYVLAEDQEVAAGETLAIEAPFVIPSNQHPSHAHGYPRVKWLLEINIKLPGLPRYRISHPIEVQGTRSSNRVEWRTPA